MIKDFLILNFIGKENKIGLRVKNSFYVHDFDKKTDNDQLVLSVLNMIKKHKVNIDMNFSVLSKYRPWQFFFFKIFLSCGKRNKNIKKN